MFVATVSASLLMYVGVAAGLTQGLKKYPHSIRGHLLGIIIGLIVENGVLRACALWNPDLLDSVFGGMLLGAVVAAIYIYQSDTFRPKN